MRSGDISICQSIRPAIDPPVARPLPDRADDGPPSPVTMNCGSGEILNAHVEILPPGTSTVQIGRQMPAPTLESVMFGECVVSYDRQDRSADRLRPGVPDRPQPRRAALGMGAAPCRRPTRSVWLVPVVLAGGLAWAAILFAVL